MKIQYKKVDDGFYNVLLNGKQIATLMRNPNYHTYPWQIEKTSGGTFVAKGGYDCFTYTIAKQVIREELVPQISGGIK